MKDVDTIMPDGYRAEIERLHFDTATSGNAIAMDALRAVAPVSQILFGSDYPYGRIGMNLEGLHSCGLNEADLRAIERENALRLVPRLAG
jgi:predicted TIM-barrel fold metal-dependent hydrolase